MIIWYKDLVTDVLSMTKQILVYTFIFSTILTTYFFCKIYKSQRVHKNLKLVLCVSAVSFFSLSTSKQLTEMLVDNTQDIENRILVNLLCVLLSVINTISLASASLCMNMLTVEQYFATIWVEDYENRSMKVGVTLIAIVFIQTVPLGFILDWYFLHNWYSLFTSKENCLLLHHEPRLSFVCFVTGCISASVCAVYMFTLYRRSLVMIKERVDMKTLSARYQQFENSTWAHSICVSFTMYFFLIGAGLTIWILYFIYDPEQEHLHTWGLAVAEIGFIQADAFSLLHILGIMFSNKFIRSAVIKDLQSIGIMSNSVGPGVKKYSNEAEEYFNQFEKAWK